MQNKTLILGAVVTLIYTAVLFAEESAAKNAGAHLGTWQLVSSKYGDAKEFSDVSKDDRHVKMITSTHFIWVMYDAKTNLVSASMGGTYSLQGAKYTETVEFFFPESMGAYHGKKQEFTIKVERDKLFQSGKLSDGQKIEEVWQRVK